MTIPEQNANSVRRCLSWWKKSWMRKRKMLIVTSLDIILTLTPQSWCQETLPLCLNQRVIIFSPDPVRQQEGICKKISSSLFQSALGQSIATGWMLFHPKHLMRVILLQVDSLPYPQAPWTLPILPLQHLPHHLHHQHPHLIHHQVILTVTATQAWTKKLTEKDRVEQDQRKQ